MNCFKIEPRTFRWTMRHAACFAFCAAMGLASLSCEPDTVESVRQETIENSKISVMGGNPPPWHTEVSVAPIVQLFQAGSTIRAVVLVQEQLPYRIANVNRDQVRKRLALVPAEELAAIKSAMGKLETVEGSFGYSARNIEEVKASIERALAHFAKIGAASSLRRLLLEHENEDDLVIFRLEDQSTGATFALMTKGNQVLAGASEVSSMYYAQPDMREGNLRHGFEKETAIDLFKNMWQDTWTPILYSLARPTYDLSDRMRKAMDTWCREPIGVRKESLGREE